MLFVCALRLPPASCLHWPFPHFQLETPDRGTSSVLKAAFIEEAANLFKLSRKCWDAHSLGWLATCLPLVSLLNVW